MNASFFLGLLLAIPIGILTNILTPKCENFLASYNREIADQRRRRQKKELIEVASYARQKEKLLEYFSVVIIKVVLVGSITIAASSFFLTLNEAFRTSLGPLEFLISYNYLFEFSLNASSQIINVVGALIVLKLCQDALSLYGKVERVSRSFKQSLDLIDVENSREQDEQ